MGLFFVLYLLLVKIYYIRMREIINLKLGNKMFKKMKNKGFTIIELMVVVVIIGALAAVAIPAYQDYVKSAAIGKSVQEAGKYKTQIVNCYQKQGDMTNCDSGNLGVPNATGAISIVSDGVIVVNVDSPASGTITLTPNVDNANVIWPVTAMGEDAELICEVMANCSNGSFSALRKTIEDEVSDVMQTVNENISLCYTKNLPNTMSGASRNQACNRLNDAINSSEYMEVTLQRGGPHSGNYNFELEITVLMPEPFNENVNVRYVTRASTLQFDDVLTPIATGIIPEDGMDFTGSYKHPSDEQKDELENSDHICNTFENCRYYIQG